MNQYELWLRILFLLIGTLLRHEFIFFFFLMLRPPPRSTLFPSPALFRSLFRHDVVDVPGCPPVADSRLPVPRVGTGGGRRGVAAEFTADIPGVLRQERRGRGLQDVVVRSEEHTSELQSQSNLVCRLLLEK